MKRPSYVKPQTLDDWKQYRLSDLFEFFGLSDHERAIMQLGYDYFGCGQEHSTTRNVLIGSEWYIQSIQFRHRYDIHKRRGHFEKTVAELTEMFEAERPKRGGR